MGILYLITCLETDKVYVGQTTGLLRVRWNCHKASATYNKEYLNGDKHAVHNKRGMCSKLYRAMNKYGVDKFKIDTIEEIDNSLLDNAEKILIENYDSVKNGYNLKYGGDRSNHSQETIDLLKEINSNNMKTTYVKFRKHEELENLPMYCIYIKKRGIEGLAINKHPLCNHKEFMVNIHGSMNDAKQALLTYLRNLEETGIAKPGFIKRDDLPKGVRKIKNSYFVDKTIKGATYRKSFSGADDVTNKTNAIEFLNKLIIECSSTTKCQSA